MGKLQPNFSWQKYEGKPEDQKQQFQYQLQTQHSLVSNSINATIDDISYFTTIRQTSETWINGLPIYKLTVSGTVVSTADTPYATPIVIGTNQNFNAVKIYGIMQNPGTGFSTFTDAEPLPYVDPNTLLNSVGIYIANNSGVVTLHIDAGNATFAGYLFNVTIEYTLM